jgi:hypothetical protein
MWSGGQVWSLNAGSQDRTLVFNYEARVQLIGGFDSLSKFGGCRSALQPYRMRADGLLPAKCSRFMAVGGRLLSAKLPSDYRPASRS